MKIDKYIINYEESIKSALKKIDGNHLGIIFIEKNNKVIGVATDGDIRRYLLKHDLIDTQISKCINKKFKFLYKKEASQSKILKSFSNKIRVIPILNNKKELVSVVSNKTISYSTTVHKPWGYYNTIVDTKDYLIKNIVIFPKQSISLQIHNYRSEHWIVLDGSADILIGNEKIKLKKNQSTYVPVKKKHKITNNASKPLLILETQLGSKLSENDIVRLEDQYNRIKK